MNYKFYLNRDMNYESIEKSEWLSAVDAHKIAHDSCENKDIEQANQIMKRIYDIAKTGKTQYYCDNLRTNVKNILDDLGYKITHSSDQRDGEYYLIEW